MKLIESLKDKDPVKKLLRVACIAGLVLSVFISLPLLLVSIIHAREDNQSNRISSNPFIDSLNEFDYVFSQDRLSLPINQLDSILNSAEEIAVSVEAHLSVLKRRRILAKEVPEYRLQYRNAASRIAETFPHSEPISIVAGDALLLQKNTLDENDKNDLSKYIQNISLRQNAGQTVMKPIILFGFYVIEGSVRNLAAAKALPQAAEMFASVIDYVSNAERPRIIADAAILHIVNDDQNGAVNLINKYRTNLLEQSESAWFMVEALYDFGDPSSSASILGIEDYPYVNSQSIIRLSDALFRMNNINDARFFWNLLLVPENETESASHPEGIVTHPEGTVPSTMLEKALYNLASTSPTDDEKRINIERLLNISPNHVPGLIMYSRMLNHEDAVSLLNQTLTKEKNAFIELELIRQNRGYSEPGKTAANTWLLLGRYPKDAQLYQWASYFFQEMRMSDEADQLEKNAGYNNIDAYWFTLQQALQFMRAGDLIQAEELLTSISLEQSWEISANLGLIKESQLSFAEAIEYYETASSLCKNNKDQALIQLNIARCFRAMGNSQEAIRVLHYASELDPDNLHVRLELRKLQEPSIN